MRVSGAFEDFIDLSIRIGYFLNFLTSLRQGMRDLNHAR